VNYRTLLGILLTATIALSMTAAALARNESTYGGAANLPLGMNLIDAGGGAGSFSVVRAWENMIGPDELQADLASLAHTYGQSEADRFVDLFNFVMADAWNRAGVDNLRMPASSGENGLPLALAILDAASTPQGNYQVEHLLGQVLTPRVCSQVLADLKAKYGSDAQAQFLTMGNEFLNQVGAQVGEPALD
jgi:hypothetical protein